MIAYLLAGFAIGFASGFAFGALYVIERIYQKVTRALLTVLQ